MLSPERPVWEEFLTHVVVLDMASPYVYVGRFIGERHGYYVLEEADAHDLRDTSTTRERYVLDSRRHGVRTNRQRVFVDARQVVAISRLDEVLDF